MLDFDLECIGTNCLPKKVFSDQEGSFDTLNGYLIQINYCIDSSQSYFSQLQKLKGTENENALVNTDDNPNTQFERKPNRMLIIQLTDGSMTIKAIEHKPLRSLNESILPGTKIKLKGKISYRLKTLLISDENIEILGGNVDSLHEKYSLINALQIELDAKKSTKQGDKTKKSTFSNSKPSNTQQNKTQSKTIIQNEPVRQQIKKPIQSNLPKKELILDNDDEDDFLLMSINTQKLNSQKPQPKQSHQPKKLPFNEEIDEDDLLMIACLDDKPSVAKKIEPKNHSVQKINSKVEPTKTEVKPKVVKPLLTKNKSDDLIIDEEDYMDLPKKQNTNILKQNESMESLNDRNKKRIRLDEETNFTLINEKNYSSIDDLIKIIKFDDKVYVVKGYIKTLTEPLKQVNMKWVQKCLISDGSHNIQVLIDDSIISEFMQLTCQEAKQLFQQMKTNPQLNDVFNKKSLECQYKLANISCLLHLKYDFKFCLFNVIKFEECDSNFFNHLAQKLQ